MADLVYAPSEFRVALAEESTFGTPITAQGSFKELMVTEATQPDYSNLIQDRAKKSDGKRVMSHTDHFVSKTGSDFQVSVSGIATDLTLDLLVFGVMQDMTSEAASTPFMKIWEWDGSSGTTDFSANEGKFFTINGYNPATDESWQMTSAVLKDLTLTADPGTNGGRLSYSATFISGFLPVQTGLTVTPASWVSPGADFYLFQSLNTKTVGGSNIVPSSISMVWGNGATRVGYDSSGEAQNYAIGVGGEGLTFNGELSVKYDANTKDEIDTFLLDPSQGSAEKAIIIQWGDGSADGTAKFDINAVYTGNSLDFGNEAGVFVNLPFSGVDDGTNEAIEVSIANAKDRGW